MSRMVTGRNLKVGDVIFTNGYGKFMKVTHVENGYREGIIHFRVEGMKETESFACTFCDEFPLLDN